MTYSFHLVDVFAERPYAGNQLAVVTHADDLSDETMQQIAAEMNFSETTFVYSARQDDGGHRVRIFTPAREIAFAGHPILGTAWVIQRHLAPDASAPLQLNLAVGPIPVTFELAAGEDETVWFQAPRATPGATCAREPVAAALGISPEDIDSGSPIRQMTAGISALIVPLRSLDALRRCKLDLAAFAPLAAQGFSPLVYLFCPQTRQTQNDLSARFFFEANGVREDPATGNGAAFLGAYLLEHRVLAQSKLFLRIEQGHEVNRHSQVLLHAETLAGNHVVSVGGRVIPVIRGTLL